MSVSINPLPIKLSSRSHPSLPILGRIPPDATRTDIEKYFGRYGTLMDVRIMAGFGFLEYDSVRDAEDAVHDLNGRDFMGERSVGLSIYPSVIQPSISSGSSGPITA